MARTDLPPSEPTSPPSPPAPEVTVEFVPPETPISVSLPLWWRALPLGIQVAITVVGVLAILAILKALISLVASLITLACFGVVIYGVWRIARDYRSL